MVHVPSRKWDGKTRTRVPLCIVFVIGLDSSIGMVAHSSAGNGADNSAENEKTDSLQQEVEPLA